MTQALETLAQSTSSKIDPRSAEQISDAIDTAWRTLTQIEAAVQRNPTAAELRLKRADVFHTLGLRTLALAEAKLVAKADSANRLSQNILAAADASPVDSVSIEEREATLRENLRWLPERLQPRDDDLIKWRSEFGQIEWLRARDGNIVRMKKQTGQTAHLQNIRGAARDLLAPLIEQMRQQPCRPIVLEGIDPPWFFQTLMDVETPVTAPGFRQPIFVIQRDRHEFYNGLACVSLGEALEDHRFEWFIGDHAASELRGRLLSMTSIAPPQCAVRNPLVRTKASPNIEAINHEASHAWSELRDSLSESMAKRSPQRDQAWWNHRYEQAASGGPPLRIAILTSRFSTYMRYAAEDLGEALNGMGHSAHLLMEPDDCSAVTETYHMDGIQRVDPDLIVTINYPRTMMGGRVPTDVPMVCWIQDAMPHLFDKTQGDAVGPLDFFVGMVKRELHGQFGYPKENMRWIPMAASLNKFQTPSSRENFDCDIAWATNHGESVEDLHTRITAGLIKTHPQSEPHLVRLRDRIVTIVSNPTAFVHSELGGLSNESNLLGIDSPSGSLSGEVVLHSYINQIAERSIRIETARWAMAIAAKRGWRLRFHGQGWCENKEFQSLAAEPIEHGDALASFYANTRVHLHASLTQPLHQRVAECAFAGGMTLSRVVRDAFAWLNDRAVIAASDRKTGYELPDDSEGRRAKINDIPESAHMVSELRRLGLCNPDEYSDGYLSWPGFKVRDARAGDSPEARSHAEAFAGMTEFFFASEQTLEVLLERAIEDQAWRRRSIDRSRGILTKTMTTRMFAEGMLSFVRKRLAVSIPSEPATMHRS